jgi:hypothetical protein
MANLGADGAFVDKGFADDHDLTIGSKVPMTVRHREVEDVHR